jgi:aspartate carbamoyltransferase catalytic subunit
MSIKFLLSPPKTRCYTPPAFTDTKAFDPVRNIPLRHLTGIDRLTAPDRDALLTLAQDYAEKLAQGGTIEQTLKGRIVLHMFFENSTRTSTSFEIAAKRLGAEVVNWNAETSSLSKGESFADTVATLNAMRPDAIVIRHKDFGAPEFVASHVGCPVINAGDSWREHPTQALLDALTLRRHFGELKGRTIAICGDVAHSRVAASGILLLSQLGMTVRVIAPPLLLPKKFAAEVQVFETLESGLPGCDAVMMLRLQKERMHEGLVGSDAEYFRLYGLTQERLALANKGAVVMHPGPMNRNVEIADDVADDPARSLILKQVENGVPVRMAALKFLVAGNP